MILQKYDFLKDNWDGHGANPVEKKCAANAHLLMNEVGASSINSFVDDYPNPNGTISLEWENLDKEKVSVEVGSDYFNYYVASPGKEPQFFDEQQFTSNDIERLREFIKTL